MFRNGLAAGGSPVGDLCCGSDGRIGSSPICRSPTVLTVRMSARVQASGDFTGCNVFPSKTLRFSACIRSMNLDVPHLSLMNERVPIIVARRLTGLLLGTLVLCVFDAVEAHASCGDYLHEGAALHYTKPSSIPEFTPPISDPRQPGCRDGSCHGGNSLPPGVPYRFERNSSQWALSEIPRLPRSFFTEYGQFEFVLRVADGHGDQVFHPPRS